MFGCHGKILRVDLSESRISQGAIDENRVKKFLGGAGLATKYLWDEVPKGADPLGPENELIFMTGILTGTTSPSAGRYSVVYKSPLTNFWGQSNSGGYWGADLKRTGFDGIILEGTSPRPVYLVVDEDKVELRYADNIWGKSVSEATKLIKEQLGYGFNVACIGIAGENQVRYACIMNDLSRAAGRGGSGAVMGSKRLKAIAVNGVKPVAIANPSAFAEVAKRQFTLLKDSRLRAGMNKFGTNLIIDMVNVRGGFPTKNWQTGVFPNIEAINAMALANKVFAKAKNCFACPIACGRGTEIRTGKYKGSSGEGPEYETVGAFGGMCLIDDLEAITMAHYLCNDYGLDVISTGSTIAFAMECYEKGILTKSDTQGLELKFGNSEVLIDLVHKIAKRETIGDLLAEGTKRMAKKLGQGADKFAMHVKGLELPAYDSRAAQLTGLAYAVANRGGDHMTAYVQGPSFMDVPFLVVNNSKTKDILVADPTEALIVKDLEDALTVFDASGVCKFMGMALDAQSWVALVANCTGWEFDISDFRKTGERIYNLARAFSMREGLTKADDTLPPRLLEEPLPEGPAKGKTNEDLPRMLHAYYKVRGWDTATGKPSPEKLRELGLEEVIQVIWT